MTHVTSISDAVSVTQRQAQLIAKAAQSVACVDLRARLMRAAEQLYAMVDAEQQFDRGAGAPQTDLQPDGLLEGGDAARRVISHPI